MKSSSCFAICIPTWNSVDYLRLCIRSICQHSGFKHPVYVHDNASTDGTREYLISESARHPSGHINITSSRENEGFCGVTHAMKQAHDDGHKYLMVFNSDMYALRFWDVPIVKQITLFERKGISQFTISSKLVEPTGNNPEYIIADYGTTPNTLREQHLCSARFAVKPDTVQYSHPILFPADMISRAGYFDRQYWPGWSSDHDVAKACYELGCRNFVMLGASLVYHFSSATFNKLDQESRAKHGQDIFQKKWNTTVDQFRQEIGVRNVIQPIS